MKKIAIFLLVIFCLSSMAMAFGGRPPHHSGGDHERDHDQDNDRGGDEGGGR